MDADGLLRDRRDTAWHFQYLHRCPRKLGDEGGPMDAGSLLRGRCETFSASGSICVAGVARSVPA